MGDERLKNGKSGAIYNTERLMRTELARVQTEAQKQSFERNGFTQYMFIANGDCCDMCRPLNGKHFDVEKMMPGENAPPMHPNCRCSVATYEDDAEYEAWLDYLDKGGTTAQWNETGLKAWKNSRRELENKGKDVKIEIDELTPCLRRLRDNTIVDTDVFEVMPTQKDFADWEFDWTIPGENGYTVCAIKAKGDQRVQGLIAVKKDAKNYAYHIDIVEAAPFNNPHNPRCKGKEYTGVGGHLFAEAIKRSYEEGYDGAVYFTAKTNLISYYEKEFGAELIVPKRRTMMIEGEAAKALYERYYGGK